MKEFFYCNKLETNNNFFKDNKKILKNLKQHLQNKIIL